jgi:nucleotide-binding universal stress UspA family protein
MKREAHAGLFGRILVPVDFTTENERALDTAVEMAEVHGCRVTLLHVIKTVDQVAFGELEGFYRKLEAEARQKLAGLEARFREHAVPVEHEVVFGKRVEEIVLFARENRIDLIVLSSRRIAPESPSSYWGALSHKIGILSPCPVMLVKEKETLRDASSPPEAGDAGARPGPGR